MGPLQLGKLSDSICIATENNDFLNSRFVGYEVILFLFVIT